MELSDKHVKVAYMKGLSFGDPEELKQEPVEYRIYDKSLELLLISKLANGEITNEAFLNSISFLKE